VKPTSKAARFPCFYTDTTQGTRPMTDPDEDTLYRRGAIDAARIAYQDDGSLEIDDDAGLSRTDDGAWVQAWVFVRDDAITAA